jgi:hypothetical protein
MLAFAAGIIAVLILFFYGKLIPDISQGLSSFAKDIISIAIPIVSFIVGTYYARKALILQKKITERKAELRLLINNSELIPNDPRGIKELVFGYSVEKKARVFCVIPFVIHNKGELDAENAHVRVTLPLNISAHEIAEVDAKKSLVDFEGSGFRRRSHEYENRWIIDYMIPRIHPGAVVGIEELVDVTYSSAAEFDVSAVSKDEVPLNLTVRLPLLSRISVSVWATDTKPLSNSFLIKAYATTDSKEIAEKIMREREEELGEELRKLNVGKPSKARPLDLLRKALIVIPKLEKIAATSERRWHLTAVYVERPKESKRWILDPAPKDGIYEIDLKKLMSHEPSEQGNS